jgi:hypothetical protein
LTIAAPWLDPARRSGYANMKKELARWASSGRAPQGDFPLDPLTEASLKEMLRRARS